MATATRTYSVEFGAPHTGLSTVGYTLAGLARTTVGVAEAPPDSGTYSVSITHDAAADGAILWDLGTDPNVWATGELSADPVAALPDLPGHVVVVVSSGLPDPGQASVSSTLPDPYQAMVTTT